MEWNQLFLEKEDWQKKTFDRIKRDLISARDNRFIRYDNSEETHLVMIYGKPQVGKTTLILNMIGLKDECFDDVYKTLRAGVPHGNSSTSTAIIYAKSINEKYGCSLSTLNDLSSKTIEYFDSSGMIRHLKKIRQQVEDNGIDSGCILFIYIPNNYFVQDQTVNNISIMDMPGDGSRNHKEDIHVQNLLTKYIPISSVCIIACPSNEIVSLETTVLPNHLDWKRMPHRFVIVVTRAYNNETARRFFDTKRTQRHSSFYEYIRDRYTKEVRKILGERNQTEVYPVDVGDTLTMLCTEIIESEADRKEVIETKKQILSDLRRFIVEHKGEKLKSALMDLEIVVKHYGEDQLLDIERKIEELTSKNDDKNTLIKQTTKDIHYLQKDSDRSELEEEISKLSSIRCEFGKLRSECISLFSSQIKTFIADKALYKSSKDGEYLKDKEQVVLQKMREIISTGIAEYTQKLKKLIREAEIEIELNESNIISYVDSNYILSMQSVFYPSKKGVFSKKEKVLLKKIDSFCCSIQEHTNILLDDYVDSCILKVDDAIRENKNTIADIDRSISLQKEKIQRYQNELIILSRQKYSLQVQRDEIEMKRRQDEKTLATYLDYANQSYMEQRRQIVNNINTAKDINEKVLFILLLGLVDKDYQKVTGGINEESYKHTGSK